MYISHCCVGRGGPDPPALEEMIRALVASLDSIEGDVLGMARWLDHDSVVPRRSSEAYTS
jgi:hypothetical protein